MGGDRGSMRNQRSLEPATLGGGTCARSLPHPANPGQIVALFRGGRSVRDASSLRIGNEAGMCPGINGFTNYAPIADWSAPYGAAVRPEGRPSRLAHIAKCAMYAPPGRGGCPSQPSVGNEAGM